jgi:hypothetical protein
MKAKQQRAQGLSWADIARRWNLQRDVQRWKKGAAE